MYLHTGSCLHAYKGRQSGLWTLSTADLDHRDDSGDAYHDYDQGKTIHVMSRTKMAKKRPNIGTNDQIFLNYILYATNYLVLHDVCSK